MDHAPRRPSMERFVLLPPLPTILPLSSLLRLPPSCNFLIRSLSLEKSGALRLAPYLHPLRTFKIGSPQVRSAFTPKRNIGCQVPMFKPCLPLLKNTGEDLAQGVGFWYAFLTSFWGPKTMVLSKREGLLPGPGLALSFWFPFFLELWLLSSCCLGLFSGAILVAIPCLDTGWILAWSFGCLFLLLFWLALSLLSWSLFCALLLCSWVPGTRVGSLHGRFSSC